MTFPFWFGGPPDSTPPGGGDAPGRARRQREHDTVKQPRELVADPNGAALLARLRGDDESALEAFVRTYAPDLTKFAYTFVRSPDLATELVDDLFVWLWEHRAQLDIHGSIRAYLFSAIRHRALNAVRDEAYRRAWSARHTDNLAAAGVGTSQHDVTSEMEVRELGILLRTAIDRLPERRRTAVLLRWMQEMSYAEIADVMGTSVIAVKQQLNRALRELRTTVPAYLK